MHSQISHRISVSNSSIADTFRERLSPLLSINSSDSPNRPFQASELNSKTLKSSRASSDCAILTHERQPQVFNNHVNTPQKDTKDVMADQGNHDQILGVNIVPNATHDANTGESSGNGENPLRDPLPIPGVSPPVVVYPHSASMIPPGYKNRFYDIVTLFRQNTVQHQKLSRHARDIDYCLKLCGPSGGQPCPSILVFCCPGAFSALRSLLSQKFLRNQYCVRKSTRERFWSSLSSHASEQETPKPYFELYFWRSPKPRVLLGFDKAEIYIGRGIPTSSDEDPGDYSWLTLSGLPIYQSPGELQASTIGCMLQIGPRYYGLVARHGIRDRYKRPLDTFNGMESRLDEEANQSNLERSTTISLDAELPYTFEISTDMDGIDDKEEYDSLEFDDDVVYEELSDMEEDEPVPPKMDNREGYDLRLIALCPSFEPSNMPLEELDLDWALIPLVEPIYQRPNAFLNPLNMSRPTFISSVVAEIPSREPKDVLIISSPQTVQSGILQPSLSLLGSINDSRPSPVGSLILKDLKGMASPRQFWFSSN